jgi:hypothetical protein
VATAVAHNGAVACAAVSSELAILATAAVDGLLVLWLLPRLRWLRSVPLAVEPQKVAICAGGIAAVMGARGAFACVGVNGEAVTERQLPGSVDFCCARGRNGADWLIVCGDTGAISIVDPVSLDRVRIVHRWAGVRTVCWDPAMRVVLATTAEPEVVVIHLELPLAV